MIDRAYHISDVVNDEFMRFPIALLANPNYRSMSLEAKFIYSLLLNRLTLSQKNDWINDSGEVYLIYTREEAADTLNISYKKTIAAFKELIKSGLLHEQRQGRGYPNLLFVLKAELSDTDAADFAGRSDDTPAKTEPSSDEEPADVQICQNGTSRHAEMAYLDMSKRHPRKIDNIYINNINTENSLSVSHARAREGEQDSDDAILKAIFDKCELDIFKPNIQAMFKSAVERLYYSNTLKVGDAHLP